MTEQTSRAPDLQKRFDDQSAVIGIAGLGYVGLPLALTFAEKGFRVLGFDVDVAKVEALNAGRNYIQHLDGARLARAVGERRFQATADFGRLSEPDALIICVPTPLTPQREPDMSYVVNTVQQIRASSAARPARGARVDHLPGHDRRAGAGDPRAVGTALRSRLLPRLLARARGSGQRQVPHRDDPEDRRRRGRDGGRPRPSLYDKVVVRTVRVGSAREAEAAKLVENIFRAVNIALVNELKVVFDRMGIDIWNVLDAAATKPFGFMRFNPGPGWGGHCIPLDPFYLSWKAREYGVTPKFIELAGEVNVEMPEYVIEKLTLALNDRRKAARGSRILVLGIAYKKDIDDPRESPAFEIIEGLLRAGRRGDLSRPPRSQGPAHAVLARPAADDVRAADAPDAGVAGRRRHRHGPYGRGLRCRRSTRGSRRRHPRRIPGRAAERGEGMIRRADRRRRPR